MTTTARETGRRPPRRAAQVLDAADLNQSIGYSIRRAQLSMFRDFSAHMKKLNVRPAQLSVLFLIRDNPGCSQSAVSAALGIQKANFVSLVDELQERELIERRKSPKDRRSTALHLTKEGESFTRKIGAAHAAMESGLAQRLGPKDSHQLLELLNRFADAAHARD